MGLCTLLPLLGRQSQGWRCDGEGRVPSSVECGPRDRLTAWRGPPPRCCRPGAAGVFVASDLCRWQLAVLLMGRGAITGKWCWTGDDYHAELSDARAGRGGGQRRAVYMIPPTAMGYALALARRLMAQAPLVYTKTIDLAVSGRTTTEDLPRSWPYPVV